MSSTYRRIICNHTKKVSNKTINPNLLFCDECGMILYKDDKNKEEKLTNFMKLTAYENERNHILSKIIKIMHEKQKKRLREYRLESSHWYMKNRKKVISYLKDLTLKLKYSDSSFYSSLLFIDRFLKRIKSDKEFQESINLDYLVVSMFVVVTKFYESNIFEPELFDFRSMDKSKLNGDIIRQYEVSFLRQINYDIIDFSVLDWLILFMENGFLFTNEVKDKKNVKMIYEITKKTLAKITSKIFFCEYSPFQLAISIIHFIRDKFELNKDFDPNSNCNNNESISSSLISNDSSKSSNTNNENSKNNNTNTNTNNTNTNTNNNITNTNKANNLNNNNGSENKVSSPNFSVNGKPLICNMKIIYSYYHCNFDDYKECYFNIKEVLEELNTNPHCNINRPHPESSKNCSKLLSCNNLIEKLNKNNNNNNIQNTIQEDKTLIPSARNSTREVNVNMNTLTASNNINKNVSKISKKSFNKKNNLYINTESSGVSSPKEIKNISHYKIDCINTNNNITNNNNTISSLNKGGIHKISVTSNNIESALSSNNLNMKTLPSSNNVRKDSLFMEKKTSSKKISLLSNMTKYDTNNNKEKEKMRKYFPTTKEAKLDNDLFKKTYHGTNLNSNLYSETNNSNNNNMYNYNSSRLFLNSYNHNNTNNEISTRSYSNNRINKNSLNLNSNKNKNNKNTQSHFFDFDQKTKAQNNTKQNFYGSFILNSSSTHSNTNTNITTSSLISNKNNLKNNNISLRIKIDKPNNNNLTSSGEFFGKLSNNTSNNNSNNKYNNFSGSFVGGQKNSNAPTIGNLRTKFPIIKGL